MLFTFSEIALFALAAFVMVLTPGPNMVYCVSRTLTQGHYAGFVSWSGVAVGFLVHLLAASFGLTALLLAVPLAFEALKIAGACYLLWLAWQAIKPHGYSPFEVQHMAADGTGKLFRMGFITNALNPKVAMFYLSFFPQFLHPERGSILLQSFTLGAIHIAMSALVFSGLILGAASISQFLATNQLWMTAQRWIMGAVLGALAVRLLMTEKK